MIGHAGISSLLGEGFELAPLIHSIKDFPAHCVGNGQIFLLYLRKKRPSPLLGILGTRCDRFRYS